jgi:uncharacterized protein
MKSLFITTLILFTMIIDAQEIKPLPMITVSGEGKVKVTPNQVYITVSVETKGSKAAEVKKENDTKTDAIIKFIAKMNVDKKDYQTQRVYLSDQYDYEKKKHNYIASQTISILLKDLSKYENFMEGIVNQGVTTISDVHFKSSKFEMLQSEARKIAVKEAKSKAEDYVSALGQKVGKAYMINDNSSPSDFPRPLFTMAKSADMEMAEPRQTLAVGEIEVTANVTISFVLE